MRRLRAAIMVAATVAALAPIAVLASGPGWAIQPTPNLLNGGVDNEFNGVSCSAHRGC
jgi:hypothetical protein